MKKSLIAIFEKIDNSENLTSSEKMQYILYSITKHNTGGKMELFDSISTSALCNENCSKRSENKKFICANCYSRKMLKQYKQLREKTERNTKFYTNYKLKPCDVPYINNSVFRFESFGELQNENQIQNYFTIARKNKNCFFVLWSKEYKLIDKYLQENKKPGNFRIIASEYCINNHFNYSILEKYHWIDKVFCTFTKDFTAKNGININCSGKCIECMKCYNRNDKTKFICEIVK